MLSKKTKYGLKALTFIARTGSEVPVQVGEIVAVLGLTFKKIFENTKFKVLNFFTIF